MFRYLGKPWKFKILFRKILRICWTQRMFAILRRRIFHLPDCYPKNLKFKLYRNIFCFLLKKCKKLQTHTHTHTQYCTDDKIEKNEIGRTFSVIVKMISVHTNLVWKSESNWPLGKHKRRRENNITTDHHEVWCGSMDWIEVAQERYRWWVHENAVIKFRVS